MKTKLFKIFSAAFVLCLVFVFQKDNNFSKIYADVVYNICAQANFKLAGCEKYLDSRRCLNRYGEVIVCDVSKIDRYVKVGDGTYMMDPNDASYYLNEIKEMGLLIGERLTFFTETEKENIKQGVVNRQNVLTLATSLHGWLSLNKSSSISGCHDLSGRTLFNQCPTSVFRGGTFSYWLDQADLPIMSSKKTSYASTESRVLSGHLAKKNEEVNFLRVQEEQKKYPDLKITRTVRTDIKNIGNAPVPKFQTILNGDQIVVRWSEPWADHCTVDVFGGVLPNQKTRAQANRIDTFSITATGQADVSIKLSCYSKSINKTSSCVEDVYFPSRTLAQKCYATVQPGWQPHQPLVAKTINFVDVEIENNGDYPAKYVEVRFVPATNFYPLHLSGTYYSPTDCMLKGRNETDNEKVADYKTKEWMEENPFVPPPPKKEQTKEEYNAEYSKKFSEYNKRAQDEREKILGWLNEPSPGQSGDGVNVFLAREYMKNIQNKSVQDYCLKDFFHWDKCEVAKINNFCSAAQIVASTHLIAQKYGLSGMGGCSINIKGDWNAPCSGMLEPRTGFNRRWQSWAVDFYQRTTPKTSKVSRVSVPYGANITEIVDGLSNTFPIEREQISFLNQSYVKIPRGSQIIEEIRPGERKKASFIIELPKCTHNCTNTNIQYGYWVVLPHRNDNMDKNVWDNFYYKNDVHSVASMVIDPVEFVKKHKLWNLTLDEIWDTGIVITGNMNLSY